MTRILHRWLGLVVGGLLCVTALSGTVLSLFPVFDAVNASAIAPELTVAELAAKVLASHPGIEQIKHLSSGHIIAWWFDGERPGSAIIDPATSYDIARVEPDSPRRWLTALHRSIFLDDAGRLVVIAGALAMLLLAITGCVMIARRTGGWLRWFSRLPGSGAGRLHSEIARITVLGLFLSSLTGLWMAAETFELIDTQTISVDEPTSVSGLTGRNPSELDALQAIPAAMLRELTFPAPGDVQDMYTIRTEHGTGYVDQGTGVMLKWQTRSPQEYLSKTIKMLHTGKGAAVIGLILGVMALGVPAMMVTGSLIWLANRRRPNVCKNNAKAAQAHTIILIGSESGTTWEFAATLAHALRDAGQAVHIAAMTDFKPARYPLAQRFIILTATYGNGDAPASARGFLHVIARLSQPPAAPVAVLGFGDRTFPAFCAYALAAEQAVTAKGWSRLLPYATVDRQSVDDFARWGQQLGQAMGIALDLTHQLVLPVTQTLTLVERRDYGAEINVPLAILRFRLPKISLYQRLTGQGFSRFEAGDLLGILPEGETRPRFYSLASGSEHGFIEIVVRKHRGGLCSGQLTALEPGHSVRGFLRAHPDFHVNRDKGPLILIGAGTGIGPLAGFIRSNTQKRPISLFFGIRNPSSDFLYGEELSDWQSQGRLTQLTLAVSRTAARQYVQDVVLQNKDDIIKAVTKGATIMVCGGRKMAQGVNGALTEILMPYGLTPEKLKACKRYVEDIY